MVEHGINVENETSWGEKVRLIMCWKWRWGNLLIKLLVRYKTKNKHIQLTLLRKKSTSFETKGGRKG